MIKETPTADPQPKVKVVPGSIDLDLLRDELELLTVQMDTKKLQVQVAEVHFQAAQKHTDRLKMLQKTNMVSLTELDEAVASPDVLSSSSD